MGCTKLIGVTILIQPYGEFENVPNNSKIFVVPMNRTAIIYCRVSSEGDRQNTDRQEYSLTNLIAVNGDKLVHEPFCEHKSGAAKNSDRLILRECFQYAVDNKVDIIYFSSLDRMGRAIWQVMESIKFCLDNHINCYFQKEQMSLYMEDGKENPFLAIFIAVISTCASIERDSIKFRLNDARYKKIAEAKASGKTLAEVGFGRPVKTKEQMEEDYAQVIRAISVKHLSVRDTAKVCGVSPATVQKVKRVFAL